MPSPTSIQPDQVIFNKNRGSRQPLSSTASTLPRRHSETPKHSKYTSPPLPPSPQPHHRGYARKSQSHHDQNPASSPSPVSYHWSKCLHHHLLDAAAPFVPSRWGIKHVLFVHSLPSRGGIKSHGPNSYPWESKRVQYQLQPHHVNKPSSSAPHLSRSSLANNQST